jgi:DNA replication and repair protein RecF
MSLDHYRNYENEIISFNEKINIIYGDNAQGKTNILEAIYLCATSKSHRTNISKELIHVEHQEAHVCVHLEKNEKKYVIDVHLKKNNKKSVAINKKPIKKLSELFGLINIIMFSPEDLDLIKGGPNVRRRFLDIELCQLNPIYYYNLKSYYSVLKQRNNLLKSIKRGNGHTEDELEVWNQQLVLYGKKIITMRREFIESIKPILIKNHYKISGEKETIEIIYEEKVLEEEFEKKILQSQKYDIMNGTTSAGPHKDDIRFTINDLDIRKYGSQGQQRTAALSLKLSEIDIFISLSHEKPILLLDDVLSELDKDRQKYLIDYLDSIQTIITCTGVEDYLKNNVEIKKMFHVDKGKII